jgi:hypothetical protein
MKKMILTGMILSLAFVQSGNAQSILSNLLSGVTQAATSSTTTSTSSSSTSSTTSDVLGNVLNSVVSSATSSLDSTASKTSSLLSNLISSVAGDVTTTASSVVGSWSYTEPAVQFESENFLTQAGGSAIAEKLETKLASIYKLVGIKAGQLNFTFDASGNVTYGVGKISRTGTYTFNSEDKTITITTAAGFTVKSYVTVSGNSMILTFDGSKLLSLMKTLGSKFNALSTITSLANSYQGMKVGFTFAKK